MSVKEVKDAVISSRANHGCLWALISKCLSSSLPYKAKRRVSVRKLQIFKKVLRTFWLERIRKLLCEVQTKQIFSKSALACYVKLSCCSRCGVFVSRGELQPYLPNIWFNTFPKQTGHMLHNLIYKDELSRQTVTHSCTVVM